MARHTFTFEQRKRGGLNLVAKRGREHMQAIGKRGAKTFWRRYTMKPAGQSGWAIVTRDTKQIVNFIGNVPFAKASVK